MFILYYHQSKNYQYSLFCTLTGKLFVCLNNVRVIIIAIKTLDKSLLGDRNLLTANNDSETKGRPLLFTNYTHLSSWLVKPTMAGVYNVGAKPTGRILVYESVSKE